ncbi:MULTISPECIES: nucleotidyltransferase family protein [Clostridia]|uniref:Nucleotidyltransferase domain-containing protein n=1 Tax=Clostridium saudiense TaxID=1414720 RepID=A0ABS2FEF4_9CLOT|nr:MULTISPECIES: nucleotidyltransferase domain-containing protein [Clostridiaceae]MBM6818366.1 nucleotidyltransferase domain-containing protein [Clostridium saudiense]
MELKDICIEIAKKYNIDTIGLFGSRARGDFQEQSDYDIFIIGNIDLNTELRLEYDLEKKLDSEVDVIKINNDIDKIFLKNILNEAIVFLDRNEAFNKTYREIENFFIENSDFIKLRERDLIG